ncbi:alpha/beta hydrolase [Kineobactrum salinum]|uniref:alpha/beta hydrolase n=1 Tax=Kineobactrum salinum TaxID=2708301 RepID=UPI0038CC1468
MLHGPRYRENEELWESERMMSDPGDGLLKIALFSGVALYTLQKPGNGTELLKAWHCFRVFLQPRYVLPEGDLARIKILSVWLLLLFGATVQANPLQLPQIKVVPIQDSALGRDYELYVKLPKDYDVNTDQTHPVIYIADARWHMEIISGSIEHLVQDAILVGISWEKGIPAQQSRMRDYTPDKYTGEDYKHPTGQAREHLAFLQNDVFKYVESEYKVDPTRRTYFGYSVSGTFGSYILLTRPKTFRNYIIGSPAPLFSGQFAHEYTPISQATPESLDANVFVSVGSDETPKYVENAFSLVRFLKSRKSDTSQVEFKVIESADHGFAFPMSGMQGLYWLAGISD